MIGFQRLPAWVRKASNRPASKSAGEGKALNLAAGRLRKLADGNDRRHRNSRALADHAPHGARLCGKRGNVLVLGQKKDEHIVCYRVGRTHACRGGAAEFDARVLCEDQFDVLREVVLAGDKQDLLDAAGDHQVAFVKDAEVAGVEITVRRARLVGQRFIVIVARAYVVAANEDATYRPLARSRFLIRPRS